MSKSMTDLVNAGDVKTDPSVGDLVLIKDVVDSGSKVFDLENLTQGITNAKFTLAAGVFSLAPRNGSKFTALGLSTTNGDVEPVSSAALSIELTTSTAASSIMSNINTTWFASNPEVELCAYLILENVASVYTAYLGLSRSPNLKQVPADYIHTLSGTARTVVGTPATNWESMFISKAGTVTTANTTCISLGFALKVTFDRTTGYASGLALTDNAAPKWGARVSGLMTHPQVHTGYSVAPVGVTTYLINGNSYSMNFLASADGTSNSGVNTVSVPIPALNGFQNGYSAAHNNGAIGRQYLSIVAGGHELTTGGGFVASGVKSLYVADQTIHI